MQFNVESLCETNLDLRTYIGKCRVVLVYGNRDHALESKLYRHGYRVFANDPDYQHLIDPIQSCVPQQSVMILLGLDGMIQYVGKSLSYREIRNFCWRDKTQQVN